MTNYVVWTPEEKASLQQQLRYDFHYEGCSAPLTGDIQPGKNGMISTKPDSKQQFNLIGYPEFDEEYEEPDTCQ
jgi:hypothetical protein